MKVIAIIPAYNEERTIGQVVRDVRRHVDEAIVVDDGSKDNTLSRAKESGALTVSHFINRGQGAALETGKKIALLRGADIIVTFDADGQFSAEEIPNIVRPIIENEAEVVLGTRFLKSAVPISKKIFLRGAIFLTRLSSGLHLSDTHNGFRAFSRKAAEKIKIEQNRMAHASEILDKIGKYNLRFKEVPVTVKYFSSRVRRGQHITDYFKILFDLFLGRTIK